MAARGDFVLIKYSGVREDLYHEVMITGISGRKGSEVTLYTADHDHYQFNIAPGANVEVVYWIGSQGSRPAHVPENKVYRFRQQAEPAERNQLYVEAQGLLSAEGGPASAVPAPVGPLVAGAGSKWVYAEDQGGRLKGDVVEELPVGAMVLADRALAATADGGSVFLQLIAEGAVDEYKGAGDKDRANGLEAKGRRYCGVAAFSPRAPGSKGGKKDPQTQG